MGRFIITGGPGSGKTTLVEALQNLGYYGFPEVARDLINEGIVPPIRAEKPDSGRFFDLILKQRIIYYQQIKGTEIGFYDRGIPDSLAYFKYQNKKVPPILSEAIIAYRYNPVVFITPPWKEIFNTDDVRRETFYEARVLYDLTIEAYLAHGYEIIELPKSSLESRVAIVLANAH